jgi:hypothetical protein
VIVNLSCMTEAEGLQCFKDAVIGMGTDNRYDLLNINGRLYGGPERISALRERVGH